MRKLIREDMQIILMILFLFSGFYNAVEIAWSVLQLPLFWWSRIAYLCTAAVLNFGFILWIQKTN